MANNLTTSYKLLAALKRKVRLRTWIALGLMVVLAPIAFMAIYGVFGATGGSDANPAAHWTFDEGAANTCSGGTNDACDISGNSNDGAFAAAAPDIRTEDLCVSGKCLLFNGTDDSVTVANTVASVQSVTFWVKVMSTSTTQEILALNASDTFSSVSGTVTVAGFGTDTIYIDGKAGPTTLTANRWHHVAVTSTTSFSASAITMGNISTNFGNIFLDELKLFTVQLSADQVKAEFAGGAAVFADKNAFLNDGLVGYWKLDENSGNATDSSGNGSTLTNVSTTAYTVSKFGNGMEPDGTADYLHAADSTNLSMTGSLTLAAWINPDDTTGSQDIIAKWDGTNESYLLAMEGAELRMYIDSASNYQASTASPITANVLQHVAGVYDASTATVKLYVNGTEVASSTTGTIPTSIGDDAGQFQLAAEDHNNTPKNFYDGHIDEARVYSRTLSNSEVKSLYNWAPGPVGYWKMDENTGTSAFDSSGNGNTGTLSNGPVYESGKYGSAVHLDGDNDDITFADIHDFANESFTVMAWVKRDSAAADGAIVAKRFNSWNNSEDGYMLYSWRTASGGNTCLDLGDGTNLFDVCTGPNTTDTLNWLHIAAVFDRTGNAGSTIYLNGVNAEYTPDGNGDPTTIGDISNSNRFCIGDRINGASNCDNATDVPFDGLIDEVKVYNYARSAQQVVEDMNAGHPAGGSPIGSQTIYWKFDTGYGTTAFNDVDANTDGTLTTMATAPSTATSGWTASGRINKGLVFDGSDDKVVISNATDDSFVDFNTAEKFSLGAWIYVTTSPGATDEDIIIGKWDETGAAEQRGYRLYITDADTDNAINLVGELYDESANQTLSAATTNEPIALNTWYHVVLTHNGGIAGAAGDLETYINGNSVATNSANASFLGVDDVTSDFTVGDYDATDGVSGNTAFTGRIDEVQVYSDELTADQVKIVANAGSNAAFGVLATTSEEEDVVGSLGNPPYVWLSFDENSGTTANDTSGNSRTGTFGSQAAYRPGKFGSAAYFNGSLTDNTSFTDDSVVYFSNDTLDGLSAFTMSFWFKPDDAGDDWQDMFGASDTGAGANIMEFAYERSTNTVNIWTSGCDGGTNVVGSAPLPDPQTGWHFFTYSTTSGGTKVMYIDGVPVTVTYSSGSGSDCGIDDIDEATTPYTIGCWALNGSTQDCYTNEMYQGYIDEFKIYNYARSAAQVAYDFNRGGPTTWYKMDDCSGTTINDLSLRADLGTALDGTLALGAADQTSAGDCTTIANTPWYNGRVGKLNYSLNFDGSDDIISRANDNAIDLNVGLTNGFTISTWVYPNSDGESDAGRIWQKASDGQTTDASINGCRTVSESGGLVTVTCRLDLATTDATVTASPTIPINQWSHIALSWTNDADDEITVWVNGIPTVSTDGSGNPNADTFSLFIGGNGSTTNDRAFDGQIDDFRIFPYEITSAQIKKVMNDGSIGRFGPSSGTP